MNCVANLIGGRPAAGDIGGLCGSIVFVKRGDQLLGTYLAPLLAD
jgi:hypothetical protein